MVEELEGQQAAAEEGGGEGSASTEGQQAAPDAETQASAGEVEEIAAQMGWRPQDGWSGDPEKWVDAKTYILRGDDIQKTLKESLGQLRRQNESMRSDLRGVREHFDRLTEAQRTKHREELKAARREAATRGDAEAVEQIAGEIEELDRSGQQPAQQQQVVFDPAYTAWADRNPWYLKDRIMSEAADNVAREFSDKNPGASIAEALEEVDRRLPDLFPTVFVKKPTGNGPQPTATTEPRRPAAPSVEGAGNRPPQTKPKKYTPSDLSSDELDVAKRYVKMGTHKNVQEYIDELVELGAIK
jgi:hypothetical protein